MYRIQKIGDVWNIRNSQTGLFRSLNPEEIQKLLKEFPGLKNSYQFNYFRNEIRSLEDLP